MSDEELLRKIAFHEKKKNDPNLPRFWRDKSEELYNYYLDLATRPEVKE